MHLQGIALAGAMQHSCVFIFPSLEAKSIGEKGYIRHDGFLACTVDDSGFVGIQQLPASAFVSTELLSSIASGSRSKNHLARNRMFVWPLHELL